LVATIKFSQFAASNLADSSNQVVGLGSGVNVISSKVVSWNTAGRPTPGYNGLLGFNTDLNQYEFYSTSSASWVQLAASSGSGTVTLINTGSGLTGGPITTSGTISLAPITSITTLTGPLSAPTAIQGPGGLNLLSFTYTPSAVNYLSIINNTTGSAPALSAVGGDANIYLELTGKGTGGVILFGQQGNALAPTGAIAELIESVIPSGSAIAIASNTVTNLTSILLDAGNYDTWGNINFSISGTASVVSAFTNIVSATLPDPSLYNTDTSNGNGLFGSTGISAPMLPLFVPFGTTVTLYLSATITLATGSATMCGGIYARRRY
jgi:hypothetical protein